MWGFGFVFLCLVVIAQGEVINGDELSEDEEGIVEENLSDYIAEGAFLYKTLWKPKNFAGPTDDGYDVTMP